MYEQCVFEKKKKRELKRQVRVEVSTTGRDPWRRVSVNTADNNHDARALGSSLASLGRHSPAHSSARSPDNPLGMTAEEGKGVTRLSNVNQRKVSAEFAEHRESFNTRVSTPSPPVPCKQLRKKKKKSRIL
ncbi:hypothetical protein RRG08_013143 [Elysia crispata]|uniref:Uncharacterized protein n=1 Tax=Elysia crispata TaxID=231223 RepID=A0AAE1A095_9GAST|nr:hypothetical protein RRG08_013143 [Elysia crispata]